MNIKSLFNKSFSKIENFMFRPKINLIKTLYINFRSLPIGIAIKMPILIYGKIRIRSLRGKIVFNVHAKFGMIRIGTPIVGAVLNFNKTTICNDGEIVINGRVFINNGVELNVCGGKLFLGNESMIGDNVRVICSNTILIGDGTRIAHESQLIDTNFHFLVNVDKRIVGDRSGMIFIGDWCWIGNKTTITKGTYLPNRIIVGSNSLLNKEYKEVQEYSIIAGIPAKFIKKGIRRVYNSDTERSLYYHFKKSEDSYLIDINTNLDDFCNSK